MMKKTIFFYFILLRFVSSGQSYHISTIKTEDGLSQNTVSNMIQDRRGSIWFATQKGVTVYNGVDYNTSTIQTAYKVKESIAYLKMLKVIYGSVPIKGLLFMMVKILGLTPLTTV